MNRNLNENSARSTAGCLPVPLFNQKKRSRQPLTSNPVKNDPDWAWEALNPEVAPLKKTANTGQIPSLASCPPRNQDSMSKSIWSNTGRLQSSWSYRDDNKNFNLKTWDKNNFRPQYKTTNLATNDGIPFCPVNLGAQQTQQLKMSEPHHFSGHKETEELRQASLSTIPGATKKGLDKNSALQAFKPNFQQNQCKKKKLDGVSEGNAVKETYLCQSQFNEKDNSLRIISAVIESMKYWREHVQKAVLLFEVLGVLDSAVTPGPYYSKSFLMRDGKNILSCIFYEIDRELPRLIRGRVHRCVGNYDLEKNIFKCVSVRPASVSEQKTFQAFVKIADTEMRYYTKVTNEI
uniref:spermatogenesis-associated protein 22 isoform X2 n=1 Tax=Jaculus jaculus TaxID=51337 RepID=UPI001E1B0661|nr:spermatogenesis-associated protein 22 isoform X2 [Jaculus jaculus]